MKKASNTIKYFLDKKNTSFINRIGITALFFFFACFFYGSNANASYFDYETFTNLDTGTICNEADWSCSGTTTAEIQETTYYSFPKALKVNSYNYTPDKIEFDVIDNQDIWSMYLNIPSSATESAYVYLLDDADDISAQIQFSYTGDIYNYSSDTNKNFTADTWFKIDIEVSSTTAQSRIRIDNGTWSNWRTIGVGINSTDKIKFVTSDSSFSFYIDNITYEGFYEMTETVEVIELNNNNFVSIVEEEYPIIETNSNPVCFVGTDCNIWVNYNSFMIDEEINLLDENNNIIDTKVATANSNFEILLTLPYTTQTASTSQEFSISSEICFEYEISGENYYGCGILINGNEAYWTTQEDYFPDLSFLNDICYDVATSSGSYADDFRYGFECGSRKVVGWMFYPSDEALLKLDNEMNNLANQFPINILRKITNSFVFETSTTSTSTLQLIPMLDQDAQIMGYLIDEEKIKNVGQFNEFSENILEVQEKLLYLLALSYFIWRIFKLNNNNQDLSI